MATTDAIWHTDAQKIDFFRKVELLTMRGNPAIWERIIAGSPTLALLSSSRVPASILLQIHDWARHWRQRGPILISGFQSETENEALRVLLGGVQPIVIVLARRMLKQLPPEYRQPIDEGRLLLVSPFPEKVVRVTAETAAQRNRVVCTLADTVLVAYADAGSKTLTLVEEMLRWQKPIMTMHHPANRHLLERGVGVYAPPVLDSA